MKRWTKLLVAAVFVAIMFVAPKTVEADVNDFVINSFEARYEIFDDTHGGRMVATETLELDFSDNNRGILRAIPTRYHGESLRLKVRSIKRDGKNEPFSTYGQGGNTVLKIGNADRTITGEHVYEIQYEMKNIISFFDNYDEWYWDINGDQWGQPFKRVVGEVIFPEGWQTRGVPEASCYTGRTGSREAVCTISKTERGYSFSADRSLRPYETLTVAAPLQKGLFTPRNAADWFRDNAWQLVGLAVGIGLSLVVFRQWWKFGKDYRGKGTIVPQFNPPKGLTPAEVGLLTDYSLDNRDLSATIIDLAVRGYVVIHDDEQKKLGVFKQHNFSLELANSNFSELQAHEKKLLQAIFKPAKKGTIQSIKTINKSEMSRTVTAIRKQLKDALIKSHGLIEETPGKAQKILWGIGIVSFAILIFIRPGWGWVVGLGIAIASAIGFGLLMRRRSHAGVEALEHVEGLKWYLKTAEKARFDKMQSVDRPYAEPARSVKLFEKLLPYAIVLGVEKSWAKQFDNIYTEQPNWYTGNYAAFNTAYLASSLTSGVSAMSTTFAQSTSSTSSGSGGGGFSGGGGGGGGGGGW